MAEAFVMTGQCVGCGDDIRIEVPRGAPGYVVKLARDRMEQGPLTECEPCLAVAERERDDAVQADDRAKAQAERKRLAEIPSKWVGQTFDALEDDEPRRRAVEMARQWSDGNLPGVVLWGGVGRGKTAIAAAAANWMLGRGRPVRWIPVAALMHGLRSGFGTPAYEEACRALEPGRGRPGLVLDDLDKLKPTDHAVEPIYLAVNTWVEAELPLFITLNRPLSTLSEWLPESFGDPIASRLKGYCRVREVGGTDRRLS